MTMGEAMQRRLAADVAGYSRLMGADELGSVDTYRSQRMMAARVTTAR